eukprot:237852-Chlamydomonas_euryale.AAC.3
MVGDTAAEGDSGCVFRNHDEDDGEFDPEGFEDEELEDVKAFHGEDDPFESDLDDACAEAFDEEETSFEVDPDNADVADAQAFDAEGNPFEFDQEGAGVEAFDAEENLCESDPEDADAEAFDKEVHPFEPN